MLQSLAVVTVVAASAGAHSIFQKLWVNGVDQGHLAGIRYPNYNGPILDVTSNDIICNGGPNPLVTPFSQTVINIPAGATVGAEWHHGLTNTWDSSDSSDPIDASHKGPIMFYLAKVADAKTTTVTGLKWFKIYEDGFNNGVWAVDKLITAKGLVSFKIPACIPSGNYFLRAELIALHPAASYPGAQFYMGCAQINVTGGGSSSPATVSFPGAYKGTDPGITFQLYYPVPTSYTIPGPRPFTCGTTTPVTSQAVTTPRTSSTTVRASSSSSRATSASAVPSGSCSVAKYGQCGGSGYTGCIVCAAGSTCQKSNDFYSQCL